MATVPFDSAIQPPSLAVAAGSSAAGYPVGAMVYSSTEGMLVVSDGTVWDLAGAAAGTTSQFGVLLAVNRGDFQP